MVDELLGASREFGKDRLADVLRQRSIPTGFAESRRMHKVDVAFDQVLEGAVGAVVGVTCQQLVIGIHRRSPM